MGGRGTRSKHEQTVAAIGQYWPPTLRNCATAQQHLNLMYADAVSCTADFLKIPFDAPVFMSRIAAI